MYKDMCLENEKLNWFSCYCFLDEYVQGYMETLYACFYKDVVQLYLVEEEEECLCEILKEIKLTLTP